MRLFHRLIGYSQPPSIKNQTPPRSSQSSTCSLPATITLDYLRSQIIGRNTFFPTPYGDRLLVYADYTASSRALHFIEDHIKNLLELYANTHTEDTITGQTMSSLLHQAECMIKRSVNAGPAGRLVVTGATGATGAILKMQQIVGVYTSPATKQRQAMATASFFENDPAKLAEFNAHVARQLPVVFVGPYEHHSNEVSWRQVCQVVEVELSPQGQIDLAHLARLLQDPVYTGRLKIVSMSACSNVTGLVSDVHAIARIAHAHGALCFFDFAASAPYVKIDMNPANDPDGALDAIFVSPHKFLGGPGAAGVLVFNERCYNRNVSPTMGGGGTVTYVNLREQDFIADVEEREKAGTPGILQTLRAGLVFELKDLIGPEQIHARENAMICNAFKQWAKLERVEILGSPDPDQRVGIVSFNLRDPRGRYLHFRLVATLLNDLFGIQSRAGCSCAGPYGHRLLKIDESTSLRYRDVVRHGLNGIKPGWCRVGFHYSMDDDEVEYVIAAVSFIAQYGSKFISEYDFDVESGCWKHAKWTPTPSASLSLRAPTSVAKTKQLSNLERRHLYQKFLTEARAVATRLPDPSPVFEPVVTNKDSKEFAELCFFSLA